MRYKILKKHMNLALADFIKPPNYFCWGESCAIAKAIDINNTKVMVGTTLVLSQGNSYSSYIIKDHLAYFIKNFDELCLKVKNKQLTRKEFNKQLPKAFEIEFTDKFVEIIRK